jgi:hypothetical protein
MLDALCGILHRPQTGSPALFAVYSAAALGLTEM